jgi:uncharacterized protein with PQ loop repeat
MLIPQLIKLWLNKSARDLSHYFLAAFNIGCLLTLLYLLNLQATVAWICVAIELGVSCLPLTVQ